MILGLGAWRQAWQGDARELSLGPRSGRRSHGTTLTSSTSGSEA